MNPETIRQNQIECDKCEGDGKNFASGAHEFFKRWRKNSGVSQVEIALVLRVPTEQLSRFENGRANFSEARQRKLARILSDWNAAVEECEMCGEPMPPNSEHSIHEKCADVLRAGLRETATRRLATDEEISTLFD